MKKFKKVQAKKLVKSNKSISRIFFFEYFLEFYFQTFRKWKISKNKFREIDSFHFTSFLAWTFLNLLGYCVMQNFRCEKLVKLLLKGSIFSYIGKVRKTSAYKYNSLLEAVSLSIENLDDFRKKLYKQLAVFLDDVGIPPKVIFFIKCTHKII